MENVNTNDNPSDIVAKPLTRDKLMTLDSRTFLIRQKLSKVIDLRWRRACWKPQQALRCREVEDVKELSSDELKK